jgi:hypothetical protein
MFDSQRAEDGPDGNQVFAPNLPESGEEDVGEPEVDADAPAHEEEDEADREDEEEEEEAPADEAGPSAVPASPNPLRGWPDDDAEEVVETAVTARPAAAA